MSSMLIMLLVYGAIIAAMYFIFFRPQNKKKKKEAEMRKNAQVGDEITTIGGICGRNDGTIQRCCSVGQVTSNLYAGGISGINDTEGSIEICFYNSDVFSGDGIGTETGKSKDVLGKNAAELYSGEVAYFLQSGQSGEIWGQDLDNGKIHQSEPSLDGEKVYQYLTYEGCNNQAPYTVSYSNTALQDTFRGHVYENGKCKYCDFFENQVGAHLAGYSLSLGGNIGVRFYICLLYTSPSPRDS